MSEIETIKGKLKSTGLSAEEYWKSGGIRGDLPDYYERYKDGVLDRSDRNEVYISRDDIVYKIEMEDIDHGYFIEGNKDTEETINFTTQFYNGSTCLTEMLDQLFKNLEE